MSHRRITGQVGQHGRHVRLDHAAAFGDPCNGHGLPIKLQLPGHQLGHSVGGHDGLRRFQPAICTQTLGRTAQGIAHFANGQTLADDAGRERQHGAVHREGLARRGADLLCIGPSRFAGRRVGVAAVNDQRGNRLLAVEQFPA